MNKQSDNPISIYLFHKLPVNKPVTGKESVTVSKHISYFSPGSKDLIIGCLVELKCFVPCLFTEESQQPKCPQVRQSRKCTQ